jgi:signal transduction histidine kinase
MARQTLKSQTNCVILVVDDQEETLHSLRTLLGREGHRVLTASSGEDALEVIRNHEVHLILLDYVMPRMTGAEVVRAVRRFDQFVQIILQTGYSGDRPPRATMAELDIQGYHDKADGPERLLLWVDVGLKAYRLLRLVRERERLQSDLVANCSHEFRTPLNIIQGFASLLRDDELGPLPDFARGPVASICHAAEGLTDLVVNFLRYAKLEAGVADLNEEWIDTADIVREMQTLGTLLTEDKPVMFSIDVLRAPRRLFADGVKLRTVLRNLIGNAAKFTTEGAITLTIATESSGMRFNVRDTGPGLRAEDQETCFEPFRQVDGSSTRHHGGVGLGLALSRRFARVMGGDLVVASTPGAGSVFTLQLPPSPRQRSGEPAATGASGTYGA